MTAPSPWARLAGAPLVAILLFVVYGTVITAWFQGSVPWWLAGIAAVMALKTLKAAGDVRRYKAWLLQWNAMDPQAQPEAKPKRKLPSLQSVLVIMAGAMFVFPLLQAQGTHDSGLKQIAWIISGLYLLFVLVRFVVRRVRKGGYVQDEGESQPVSWLIGRASSSPSREDATDDLPDYCATLLSSSSKQEE
jgi:hypothetical protein